MNLFYIRFMVCDLFPTKLVEFKYFPEFLKCFNSKFNLPSRQTYAMIKIPLMSYLIILFVRLISLLSKVNYLATYQIVIIVVY